MNIRTESIGVVINEKQIINEINILVESGKFIGIIGPNGSGKSTLLKCIYRVLKPTKGVVYLEEKKIEEYSYKSSAQKLAVVAQHNFASFDFKIEEVVLMGRSPYKRRIERDTAEDYRIVNDCIEKVGMSEFKGRNFSSLSGGEQQRVILARALAQQTECIILDEPTNHLDIKYQLQLLNIVKESKLTVVSAMHDLNIAAMYCDYIYAMKDGQIKYKGKVSEVMTEEHIYDLYEVNSTVSKDEEGRIHIRYYS